MVPERSRNEPPPLGAQAIQRAFGVLQCFTVERPAVSLTEITKATGLTLPTAHRIVKTLQSNQFLDQEEPTGKYTLGPALLRLAEIILRRHDNIASTATPHLERLRDLTTETVGLHTPLNGERICILEIVGHHAMRMATGVGHVYPLYAGAAGKAILAWLPKAEVGTILSRPMGITGRSAVKPANLRKELALIKQQGYAISAGETVPGARALAAPIFSSNGIIGSINIAGPEQRWSESRVLEAVPDLLTVTRSLSRQFGSPVTEG